MSLPLLLLVDDSEAILAFERAALSSHYACSTAVNGVDALEKARQLRPTAILLDLSMPEMDGDEALARLQDDPELKEIPVIIVSSEKDRAQWCLRHGAKAFLPKPIRADELLALVGRVLEDARRTRFAGSVAILCMSAGTIEFALPLVAVRTVLPQLATSLLPLGPRYLSSMFELEGEPIFVLDVAMRLGVEHTHSFVERKLVVIAQGELQLALAVDDVRDPEEVAADELVRHDQLGGADFGPLANALIAIARTPRGMVPLLSANAFLSVDLMRRLVALRSTRKVS